MKRRAAGLFLLAVVAPLTLACTHAEAAKEKLASAELGAFYGGEVQERRTVTMPTDRPRPTLGFRLSMVDPLRKELAVRWEIEMPGPRDRRVQTVGEARVPVGQSRFDQVIAIPENAALGLWNVRVIADERIVIDRAMVLQESP